MNIATELLPASESLHVDGMEISDKRIDLRLTSIQRPVFCPMCKMAGSRVHSHYTRKFVDAPWAGIAVHIQLCVRRFFCDHPLCGRTTFTEQIAELIAPFAQRTLRLAVTQRSLGLALGGEAGARLAKDLAMKTSPDTLLRLVRQAPEHQTRTPRVLGIDDWAFKKGCTYGTVLVDLEQRQIVELLSDRTADTVTNWLQQHPGVEIVTRDRASAYADAVTHGAPKAIQVADRFHLLMNLRETLERFFDRHQADLRQVKIVRAAKPGSLSNPLQNQAKVAVEKATLTLELQYERNRRRLARYEEVRTLKQQGYTQHAISARLGMSRNTIRRYLRYDVLPARGSNPATQSKVGIYAPYLQRRWQDGCRSPRQLWNEIHRQGFQGSEASVWRWLLKLRVGANGAPSATSPGANEASMPALECRTLSSRQAAWIVLHRTEELKEEEKAWLEQYKIQGEPVVKVFELAQQFTGMVKEKASTLLPDWIVAAKNSGLVDLRNFALGLQRDFEAVSNALKLPWSNGPTEGHVNRLKVIKRQMYGRAKFDLLRCRVLPAG